MDIDKMFKVPKLPMGGNKRKMPDAPTPDMLKRMRMEPPSMPEDVPSGPEHDKGKSRAPIVRTEEEEEEASLAEDGDFAPGGDADYFAEEDEEGRFFGGGLTQEQKDILNIFDRVGGEGVQDDPEMLSATSIRKLLLRFERAVEKNQDQRSKYPDDPSKFIDSEADLDVAIKALLPLSQAPSLAYPELVRSGAAEILVGLLSHENADIVIDVVELVHELTDEDVGDEADEDEEDDIKDAPLKTLIDGLQAHSILELLVDNLSRLKEEEESDRQGVFHILGIFENIVGFNPQLSTHLVAKTNIVQWLLKRVQAKKQDENRGYAAELLVILLQDNRENRARFGKEDGVETLLTVASQYRKRDPVDADETEFMENIFDALCSALGEAEIKQLFLKSEGVDLMVLLMKEKREARSRAIKILDHAMSGNAGTQSCETFVEALGLKTIFSALMGKASSKKQKSTALPASEETSHILGIVSSLFSNLPSDSPARIRVLAKFVESNYEKVEKMLELREGAQGRLNDVEKAIEEEKKVLAADGEEIDGEQEVAWYLQRLEGGLFTLQTVDYIIAWVAMEDDGIRAHLTQMLSRRNKSLKDVAKTLQVYHDNVDEQDAPSDDGSSSQKEILQGLMTFLNGC